MFRTVTIRLLRVGDCGLDGTGVEEGLGGIELRRLSLLNRKSLSLVGSGNEMSLWSLYERLEMK